MKIVCGTDFSQHAAEAGQVAAMLAARRGGSVALVHVFEAARYELVSDELLTHLLQQRQERLKGEAQRLGKTGVTVEAVLLQGSPSAVLAGFAEEARAQLVVVSSLGQIAPSRWFVGSVAERVAQLAPVPTLVVRGEQAFRRWTEGEQPLGILVGFDFSGGAEAALEWVAGLREIGPCVITVASLASPPQENWRLGMGEPRASLENQPEVQETLERDLKQRCGELLGKVPFQIHVAAAWGRMDSQLIDLARAEHADLMVVGVNRRPGLERFWFGSVSRGILHHAPVSVACVPASAASR